MKEYILTITEEIPAQNNTGCFARIFMGKGLSQSRDILKMIVEEDEFSLKSILTAIINNMKSGQKETLEIRSEDTVKITPMRNWTPDI